MKRGFAWGIISSVLLISQLFAGQINDEWTIFGPQTFYGQTGTPKTYTRTFTVPILRPQSFNLTIVNGNASGSNRVTNATIKLNGVTVVTPSEFNFETSNLTKEVTIQSSNTLQVTVNGSTGSYIKISCGKHLFPIQPILECVEDNGNGTYTAHFGYSNSNSYPVTVPIGLLNMFLPIPINRGQPTVFEPGTQQNVFTVVFNGRPLIWEVRGRIATATNNPALACSSAVDTTCPNLSVTAPVDGIITSAASVQVNGTATDASPVTVTINGTAVTVDASGGFSGIVNLAEGSNIITVIATDAAGNQTTVTRNITRDSIQPVLTVTEPVDSTITNQANIAVSGTVTDASVFTLIVNGSTVQVGTGGAFNTQVALTEGINTISISAIDTVNNQTSVIRTVIRDTEAPVVNIQTPTDNQITNQQSIDVNGTITDLTTAQLTINGNTVSISAGGTFNYNLPIAEGLNTITLIATDAIGNQTTITRTVRRDTEAPILVIQTPENNQITNQQTINVSGTVTDSTMVTLTANGINVPINAGGAFSYDLSIVEGQNVITVVATDAAGNESRQTIDVRRDTQSPVLSITSPLDSLVTNQLIVNIIGTVTDSTAIQLTVNGEELTVNADGNFSHNLPIVEGLNTITIVATDTVGNQTTVTRIVRRDTQVPIVNVTSPTDSLVTNQQTVIVSGMIIDSTAVQLTVNGNPVTIGTGGAFSTQITLTEGINTITIVATDAAGNQTTVTRTVTRDTESPVITLISPIDSLITNQSDVTVSGSVGNPSGMTLTVNGNPTTIETDGTFSTSVGLNEGLNAIILVATDPANNQTTITRMIRRDTQSPVITITSPIDSLLTNQQILNVNGIISDSSIVNLTINGNIVSVAADGSFNYNISLNEGINNITITATDAAGNTADVTRIVMLDSTPPVLTITSPADGTTTSENTIQVSGTVTDLTDITLTINGTAVSVNTDGSFNTTVSLVAGPNTITITAIDYLEQATTITRTVTMEGQVLPPDPTTVAPPIDQTVVTTLAAATEFLYTGPYPIQTGVEPGTIDPVRVAVIRGKVLNRDLTPLSGVKITILNHSEFGSTLSRADGMFDIAVNGGGLMTINYDKQDYFSVQRKADVPWQEYVNVDSVILIHADPQVTTIGIADTIQVARASIVTDQDGTRQATLLFKPQTNAKMILQNGDTVALSTFNVRATEYTVGPNGIIAMPAELPPSVAYTYCVNLTTDEGIAANAKSIQFDKPVNFYLDNFIEFPTGSGIPVGYYDEEKGVWIGSQDARVIQILNNTDGVADIDLNGDGIAEDDSILAFVGITLDEQRELAKLYLPGKTLWRGEVQHFSPYDFNPCFLEMLAKELGISLEDLLELLDSLNPKPNDNDIDCGSTIQVQNQTLGQFIPINGTPFSLSYSTGRVTGKGSQYEVKVPVSDTTLPNEVYGVVVHLNVAGKNYTQDLPAEKSLWTILSWDGKDAYGRIVNGKQRAKIKVGYKYYNKYWVYTERTIERDNSVVTWSLYPIKELGAKYTVRIVRIPKIKWHERTINIGGWDAASQKIGGWEFDNHHVYSYPYQTVIQGDGIDRSAGLGSHTIRSLSGTVEPDSTSVYSDAWNPPSPLAIAPDGSVYYSHMYTYKVEKRAPDGTVSIIAGTGENGYSGDGGPATQAMVGGISGLAIGPDGSIYMSDFFYHCIRKITPGGIITTIAGTGIDESDGDEGPAIQASINEPGSIVLGPDGSLYIVDSYWSYHGRVRRITPDGIIHTCAGTGEGGFSGDGGLADTARLDGPCGICLNKYGELYITDNFNGRIRKVSVDGIITTIAGTDGYTGYDGEGDLATSAEINPRAISVTDDGTIFFVDYNRVRCIRPNGILFTLAGNGDQGLTGDDGAAIQASLNQPDDIKISPNGDIYFSDGNTPWSYWSDGFWPSHRIRYVSLPFSGYTNQQSRIATEDASQVQVFDNNGRHLRTENAITGNMIHSFIYNTDGTLSSIRDIDSLTTTIERDASGYATAIVSPYGQRTKLSYDPNGYLSAIVNPAGDTTHFTYDNDGLMATLKDPKLNTHYFEYDSIGRLRIDIDPEGGFKQYERTQLDNGYEVLSITAEGRKAKYKVESLPGGGVKKTNTDESGFATITIEGRDGIDTVITKDGTITTTTKRPDPRFGMQSPLVTSIIKLPSGLTTTVEQYRTISQMSGLTVTSIKEAVAVNGRRYTKVYAATEGSSVKIDAINGISNYGFSAANGTFTSIIGQQGTVSAGSGDDETYSNIPIGFDFTFSGSSFPQIAVCTNGWISFNAGTSNANSGYDDPRDLVTASDIYPLIAPLYDDLTVNGGIYHNTSGTAPNRKFIVEWNSVGWNYDNPGNSISFQVIFYEQTGTIQYVYSPGTDGIIDGGAVIGMANEDGFISLSDLSISATVSSSSENDYIAVEPTEGLTFSFTPSSQSPYIDVPEGGKGILIDISPERRLSFSWVNDKGRAIKDSISGIEATYYEYNKNGKVVTISRNNKNIRYAYNEKGLLAASTDPIHRMTYYEYNPMGKITRQILTDSTKILFSYDSNNNLKTLSLPDQRIHNYQYSKDNLIVKYTPPVLGTDTLSTRYEYNKDKQITKVIRADSGMIIIVYDTLDCSMCENSTGKIETILFDRGKLDFKYNLITETLDTIIAPQEMLSYSYFNSMPTSTTWSGEVNGTIGMIYDNDLNLKCQNVNGEYPIDFIHDNDGLLTQIGSLSIQRELETGKISGTELEKITTSHFYNNVAGLNEFQANFNGVSFFKTKYERDSLERITQIFEITQGYSKKLNYEYDIRGRIWKVWRNDTLISIYTYDNNGNRISHWTPTRNDSSIYDVQDRLIKCSLSQYQYNSDGDLKLEIDGVDTTHYTYDFFKNLVKVVLPNSDVIEYVIDGQNRRIAKKVNGKTIKKFLYSGQLAIAAELDSLDQVISRFSAGYFIKQGVKYRLITDHLGSVRLVINALTAEVAQQLDYDEYGNVLYDSNPGFQPFGYAGGIYDPLTKLVRYGVRDYAPKIGRWTTKDPLNIAGGINFYIYSANDPINFIDIDGKQPWIYALIGSRVHNYIVLPVLRERLGPRNVPVTPIPGGGRNGGYGMPDLLVATPAGTEIYELKPIDSYETGIPQITRYVDAAAEYGVTYTPGISLSGDASVLAPIPVPGLGGVMEYELYLMEPGIIGYSLDYCGPSLSPRQLFETLKNPASFSAALLALLALLGLLGALACI